MSSELSFSQKRELYGQALEVFEYFEKDKTDPQGEVWEIVEAWLPVYFNHIRDEWIEAGCPEPEEFTAAKNVHEAMTMALNELATAELSAAISNADNCGEAVEALISELKIYAKS